jgi:ribosome-binding protein aMBF1 (putative translation factor)
MKSIKSHKYIRGQTLKEYINEQMKNPKFKKAWHELDPEFELLASLLKARVKEGITQEELARRIGTKQSVISRLERGALSKATLETLKKIADALDRKLVIKLQEKRV